MRRPSALAGFFLGAIALAAAPFGCGSRGPLDDAPANASAAVDASSGSDPSSDGATTDPGLQPGTDRVDAGREAAADPIACGRCVATECGDKLLQCLQDTACRTVFQCAATTCAQDGFNPVCLIGCAGNSPGAVLNVLGIVTCVTGTCGSNCGSVLDGLGGLAGGRDR